MSTDIGCALSNGFRLAIGALAFLLAEAPGASAQRAVNETMFQEAVARHMGDSVKGYAMVLVNKDGIQAKASGGWAQAPGDGGILMKTFVPSNIGSVSKVLSGIALLDLLEARGDIDAQLAMPIRFFVPDKWWQAYFNVPNSGLSLLTFAHLLKHRTGLPIVLDGGAHGTKIGHALSLGADLQADGWAPFKYNNENFTLLLYIIPAIAYPAEVGAIEEANAARSLRDYNTRVAREYGALYERYMREQLFPRVLGGIAPTCRNTEVPGGRFAKEYTSRDGGSGHSDNPDFCRSQGSWKLSAQDLAKFARTVEFTDVLVEGSTRRLFKPATVGGNLIFWRRFPRGALLGETGSELLRGHGGSTSEGARAVYVRLPYGYAGIALANSPERFVDELAQVLVSGLYEASRGFPELGWDRPGSNIRDFTLNTADPALCRNACNKDAGCGSWTYVKPGVQHSGARCWLKSGAPRKVASGCCVSGVKDVAYNRDRPGGSFRDFDLDQADPALCQSSCARDSRCRSWTYVRPGVQGQRARCWLKETWPGLVRSSCCDSAQSPPRLPPP